VGAIVIPKIQRDYAQGRSHPKVQQIRERFIDSLFEALDSPNGIDLDFVFGDLVEETNGTHKVSTLYPLDGQQRLTTLFLLHCYLAWHIPEMAGVKQPWHAFSYATRPGARRFCEFLTECRPTDLTQATISGWLKDQARYLPTWKHDPTIQGMLVMLDVLHTRYSHVSDEKPRAHWNRLTDLAAPAIRFHLLPIQATGGSNTLYVKMNSRGKPLTEFENFKAELQALLRSNPAFSADTLHAFSQNIDTVWADLFWHYRGDNDLIDEEFMRYLRFLLEVWAWKQGEPVNYQSAQDAHELVRLAQLFFGAHSGKPEYSVESLNWVTRALDVWLEPDEASVRKPRAIQQLFEQLFTRSRAAATKALPVFNFRDFDEQTIGVDMFRACCDLYGTGSWRLAHTLLFYGVLLGILGKVPQEDMSHRLRLLRNLIEASPDDIRAGERNNMPQLLAEVEVIMAGGPLDEVLQGIRTFNQVQVQNERDKREFLMRALPQQDTLHRLEDHELLRGGLTVFNLNSIQNAAVFEHRAARFSYLFTQSYSDITAALLAYGHEGRWTKRGQGYRLAYLGAPKNSEPWDNLFRARRGEMFHPSSAALLALLDDVNSLTDVINSFVSDPATLKDWRYYMVKYAVLRSGASGSHVIGPEPGYALCMLSGYYCDNRTYHYDSYLLALATSAEVPYDRIGNDKWPRCFSGDGTEERHLELRNSGLKIRCVNSGWQVSDLPDNSLHRMAFDQIARNYPLNDNRLFVIPQKNGIDTEDRIALGAPWLRELVAAGL